MFTANLLKGTTLLVTGGGSGLGAVIALRAAAVGSAVAVVGRREAPLRETVAAITAAGGVAAYASADVRDPEAVRVAFDSIETALGPINSVVNNAAGNFFCASEDLSPNAFKSVIDIVLCGTFHVTTEFGRRVLQRKVKGSVLNIVTTYTTSGSAFVLPSACAKGGVAALTTSLAYEWGPLGIRVNAIAPGPFPTAGAWERLVPDGKVEQLMINQNPLRRFGTPDELANLAAFMLSDGAAYMNGEIVTLDGGERWRGGQFNFLAEQFSRPELKSMFSELKQRRKS